MPYEYSSENSKGGCALKLTFLWEHALHNHLFHFIVVHEILRQVNQSSLGIRDPAHIEYSQSRCSQLK